MFDGLVKSRIQSMCHSRLPMPETIFSLCASISGYGGQVDRREKSYIFSVLHNKDFSLAPFGLSYIRPVFDPELRPKGAHVEGRVEDRPCFSLRRIL